MRQQGMGHPFAQLPGAAYFRPTHATGAQVLVIDHYDSFTFNLVQLCLVLGAEVIVVGSHTPAPQILGAGASHWIMSPGPGTPQDAGVRPSLWRYALQGQTPPVLGVCLGHQGLCAAAGAHVVRAGEIMHGKRSDISHDGQGLFAGVAPQLRVVRYHSLIVDAQSLPSQIRPCAWTVPKPGHAPELMGVAHLTLPLFGLQFHPESIGSSGGHELLSNFLAVQG